MKTYRCGNDCLGNASDAMTMEGFCVGDIYSPEPTRYYNQKTGERGKVIKGDDGELHFVAAPLAPPREAYCVVRKSTDDGHEWLDVKNSMGGTSADAQVEAAKIDRAVPGWAKDNPVVRVAKVRVVEIHEK